MLKIAKNNTPAYDYLSEGDGSDPASVSGVLDGQGGTVDSAVLTLYLIATTFRYTNISLAVDANEDAGIDWKISLDNVNFFDSVTPNDMDALGGDQVLPIYLKAVVNNDGSVPTGVFTNPDINLTYRENPS